MHVLHAAKKYQLLSLVEICVKFLNNELKASNACSILEHSIFFNESELAQKCLKKLEENTHEALTSKEFMDISRATLSRILDSNALEMDEVKLFERCHDWANAKREGNQVVRDVLGEALFKIRFPVMSAQSFTDIVCPTNVFTPEEQLDILKYLNTSNNAMHKLPQFVCEARKPG